MRRRPYLLAAALVLVAPAAAAQQPAPQPADTTAPRPLRPEDFARVQNVRDPQISADGGWVAYSVGTTDLEKDKNDSDIWMASWDGSQEIRLTSSPESESSPRWSPDGRWLSFLSSRQEGKGAQLWLLDRRGGEARRVTEVKGGISDYAWAPDASRVVLVIQDSEPGDTASESKPKPIVIDRYHFKSDGDGYLTRERSHLYLFDLASERLDTLTTGDFDDEDPAWSPDGRRIAFVSKREGDDPDRGHNDDVYLIDARSGASPVRLTSWKGSDTGPLAWSPDGRWVAYLRGSASRMSAYNLDVLALVPAAGGEPRLLTADLDRDVSGGRFSRDGKWLYFLVTDDGVRYPARVPVGGGAIEKVTEGERVVEALTLSPGGRIALTATTPDRPTEVFALDRGSLRRLTHRNDRLLGGIRLGAVRRIAYTTGDGADVHAMLFLPVDYQSGTKYPTLLRIHGGPNGQNGFEFDFERQLFAGAGYAVLSPNYRGSSGRGRAWKEILYQDWGDKEVIDVLAGVDRVVQMGIADPDRLGIGGWSYGCYTTLYALPKTDRFRAAVCGAGNALQPALYGVDQYIVQYDQELGPPWKNPDLWLKLSYPFFQADSISTPTLFLGGEKDFNVPVVGVQQMYQALRSLGVPTELIIYPGEHHGIRRPSFVLDRYRRYLDWYARYLQPGRHATR